MSATGNLWQQGKVTLFLKISNQKISSTIKYWECANIPLTPYLPNSKVHTELSSQRCLIFPPTCTRGIKWPSKNRTRINSLKWSKICVTLISKISEPTFLKIRPILQNHGTTFCSSSPKLLSQISTLAPSSKNFAKSMPSPMKKPRQY